MSDSFAKVRGPADRYLRTAIPGPMIGRRAFLAVVLMALLLPVVGSESRAEEAVQADRIVVLKGERRLLLMRDGEIMKSYWVALGRNPTGHKVEQGDGRTPEGLYRIEERSEDSLYYRSMRISYPSGADRARAQELGVDPGGNILIHAVPDGFEPTGPGVRMIDWTNGCIAVTNADMDDIWTRVPDGVPVEIRP